MRFPKYTDLNQKKGISSIVGGIFFLVLMTSGFTVYYVALDSQSQMLDTQQIIADSEVAKIKEKFVIAASSSGINNVLSVQVINTGNNPVEIADIWIINKTTVTQDATKYNDLDFRDVSIPVGYGGNVLKNHTPLNLISAIYDIKVVSSLGTIQTVEYDVSGGSNLLSAQMVAIPQDVRFGENVTIALVVTNTGTTETFTDVTGNTNKISVSPNQCEDPPSPIFAGPTVLSPSQSIMFFWDCVLLQPTGNTITFIANATGKLLGVDVDSNDAADSVIVRDFAAGGEEDEIVLKDELFGKPQILMTFPNPMGDDQFDRAFWGVNVVNPTDVQVNVTKVVVIAISPRPNSDDKVFAINCSQGGSEPYDPQPITPTTGTWSCDNGNQLQWQDQTNPITIQPRSVAPFTVQVGGDVIGTASTEINNILIQTTIFTTLGQFGKAGYMTSMNKEYIAMPNVYLSSVPASTNPADLITEIRGIIESTSVTFTPTIADMDIEAGNGIKSGSRLIVNIPKDWTYNLDAAAGAGFNPIIANNFPDGSWQLIGILSSDLNNGARSFTFSATPPAVSNAKMYVMHILADGTASGDTSPPDFSIGPISEAVLQVCPTTGGPQPECPP